MGWLLFGLEHYLLKSDLQSILITYINPWILKNDLFIYLWLWRVFAAEHGLSLIEVTGGYSVVAVCRLLFAVASLVAEHGP